MTDESIVSGEGRSPFVPHRTFEPFPGIDALAKFDLIDQWEPVGSRITCDPAPTDTDEDWIVFTEKLTQLYKLLLNEYGFTKGGSELVDDQDDVQRHAPQYRFISMKLGPLNLILTGDYEFFRRFVAASSVAKRLNLMDKDDRIALFQAVLYGNSCDGVRR